MVSRKKTFVLIALAAILAVAVVAFVFRDQLLRMAFRPTDSVIPEGSVRADDPKIVEIAKSLETPWGIVFLPSGDILVTERPGTVKRITSENQAYPVAGVTETSEGGLLGIALHPQFSENKFVYLYLTYQQEGSLFNRVERYTYDGNTLQKSRIIIDGIPGASNHDGGALAFGPDSKLYITTGDAGNPSAAQNTALLPGKILRLNGDGSVPADNPFGNPVYSYGHRNPQGITWDDKGRMWATEHGPSGSDSGRDELNLIEKGANYGWPTITGDETRKGMRRPIVHSGDSGTWAPGGIAYSSGALYFSGLRGETLYQVVMHEGDNVSVSLKRHFTGEYGRLRAVAVHDEHVYISTSNTDGRGSPRAGDDKIIQISTSLFRQ